MVPATSTHQPHARDVAVVACRVVIVALGYPSSGASAISRALDWGTLLTAGRVGHDLALLVGFPMAPRPRSRRGLVLNTHDVLRQAVSQAALRLEVDVATVRQHLRSRTISVVSEHWRVIADAVTGIDADETDATDDRIEQAVRDVFTRSPSRWPVTEEARRLQRVIAAGEIVTCCALGGQVESVIVERHPATTFVSVAMRAHPLDAGTRRGHDAVVSVARAAGSILRHRACPPSAMVDPQFLSLSSVRRAARVIETHGDVIHRLADLLPDDGVIRHEEIEELLSRSGLAS